MTGNVEFPIHKGFPIVGVRKQNQKVYIRIRSCISTSLRAIENSFRIRSDTVQHFFYSYDYLLNIHIFNDIITS